MVDKFIPHLKDWAAHLPDLKRRDDNRLAQEIMDEKLSWSKESPYKVDVPKMKSVLEHQVGGSDHYKDTEIQPIEFIAKNDLSFTVGNVIKYLIRAKKKGGAEDVCKAIHYCQIELELKYGIRSEVKYQE